MRVTQNFFILLQARSTGSTTLLQWITFIGVDDDL